MSKLYRVVLQFNDGEVEFNKGNGQQKVSLLCQITSNNILPEYGVNGRTGSIELLDSNDVLYNRIANRVYPTQVIIYLDNDVIGRFVSAKKYEYIIFTKKVAIEIVGNITNWQNVMVEKKYIEYDVTGYYVLQYLMNIANTPNNLYTFSVSSEVQSYLESITIPYFYLEKASLWEQFGKVCDLAQLYIYQDKYNNIIVERFKQ